MRKSHILAHFEDYVLSKEVEGRERLVERILFQLTLDLALAQRGLLANVTAPYLNVLYFHVVVETHWLCVLDTLHVIDVSARVLELITPRYEEEIPRDTQSTTLFIIGVNVTEALVMRHGVMKLFVRGIVADKIGLAEWNLVVEFMSPGVS